MYLFGKITWDERVSVGILEKRLIKKIKRMCEKGLQKGTMCGKVSLSNVKNCENGGKGRSRVCS